MALEPAQQLEKLLEQSKNVLILTPQNPSGDAVGSAWAFYFFLKKKKIDSTIAFSGDSKNIENFSFLPKPENITHDISGARDFVLSFNTNHNKIMNVSTEKIDEEFRIYITPEHGSIDPRDFSFIPAKFKYDLIVALDCPDKESTGKIYEENPDIFYEVPIVNIDHHSHNDNFGQVNLVSLPSSSTSEILTETLEQINSVFDENIANCLLTGIISATESFQKRNTTPKSLQISARLMDKGADQQKIIRYLYKTQSFHLLKLWGRIMSRLNWDESLRLAWSEVTIEDFVQSRSSHLDIPFILEKIKNNYSDGELFMVFFRESNERTNVTIKFSDSTLKERIISLYPGELKDNLFEFKIENKSAEEAKKDVLEKLRSAFKQ
jgi:nanoRNase/pAp phosphatase (c-di-AMP/oligoRNAs hydrolase)